jgi:hypothetical protein
MANLMADSFDAKSLRGALRHAGLSRSAIDAAWPDWWTDEAETSPSARADLRFALAHNLGLSPKALIGERVEFVWRDRARFKNLTGQTDGEQAALNSFGTSIGRLLLRACPGGRGLIDLQAIDLRQAILASQEVVGLQGLLSACWAIGIPTIALRVFPLETKAMHAMVVAWDGRHAILLAREASYPAPIAFTVAHEIGHAALGHVSDVSALVDIEDPATSNSNDADEIAADCYALTLLTGSPDPDVRTTVEHFGGQQLAAAADNAGPPRGIEPGTLALCAGFRTGNWAAAMSALRYIYPAPQPMSAVINQTAQSLLNWGALNDNDCGYLRNVMGITSE